MNKKGDFADIPLFVITLFFVAIAFIVVVFVNSKFSAMITDTEFNNTNVSAGIVKQVDMITTTSVQRGYVLIFAVLVISTVVSSFMIGMHPVFFFIWILLIPTNIILGVILGNVYEAFIEAEALAAIASQQGMMNFIMNHLLTIMIAVDALSMIILFTKVPNMSGGDV